MLFTWCAKLHRLIVIKEKVCGSSFGPVILFGLFRSFSSTVNTATQHIKPHLNLCLLGDYSHGKTTLSSAITLLQNKKNLAIFKETHDIDNAREEVERKCSINPAKMEFNTIERNYCLTDAPGSPDYLKNTIIGCSGADIAVIVVAGDEGPTKVTRNHIRIAKYLGTPNIFSFINKSDKADGESLGIVELATKEMLDEEGVNSEAVKFFYGSAKGALDEPENIDKTQAVEELVNAFDQVVLPKRDLSSQGFMYIHKIYSLLNRPTGVTGTIERGMFSKGDKVDLVGFNKCVRTCIIGIESFGTIKNQAIAGDSCEILVKSVKKSDLVKGMAIIPSNGSFTGQDRVEILLKMIPAHDEERYVLFNGETKKFYAKTGEISGQVVLKDKEYLVSGDSSLLELWLPKEFIFQEKQSLLFLDDRRIFAYGEVTQLLPNLEIDDRKKLLRNKTRSEKETLKQFRDKIYEEMGIKIY